MQQRFRRDFRPAGHHDKVHAKANVPCAPFHAQPPFQDVNLFCYTTACTVQLALAQVDLRIIQLAHHLHHQPRKGNINDETPHDISLRRQTHIWHRAKRERPTTGLRGTQIKDRQLFFFTAIKEKKEKLHRQWNIPTSIQEKSTPRICDQRTSEDKPLWVWQASLISISVKGTLVSISHFNFGEGYPFPCQILFPLHSSNKFKCLGWWRPIIKILLQHRHASFYSPAIFPHDWGEHIAITHTPGSSLHLISLHAFARLDTQECVHTI